MEHGRIMYTVTRLKATTTAVSWASASKRVALHLRHKLFQSIAPSLRSEVRSNIFDIHGAKSLGIRGFSHVVFVDSEKCPVRPFVNYLTGAYCKPDRTKQYV